MAEVIEAPSKTSDIPLVKEPTIDDEINSLTALREKKHGKAKTVEQPTNLAEGEEIPKAAEAKEPAKTDPKAEKEVKPKKEKFWKKEKEATPTNGELPKAAATDPAPAEVKIPKEFLDRLEKAEALLNRPSVKTVLKAEESGDDYNTFREKLEAKNPMRMSYQDIYKVQLDRDGYSEAEKARKLERFSEKDEDDQADIITHTRKELKAEFDKEINDYTPKFEKTTDPAETAWSELASSVPDAAKAIENKELYGVLMTPELLKSTSDINIPILKTDKDGRIDPTDFLRVKHIVQNFDLIAETIENQVRLEVTEEFETRYNLPLSAETGNHVPQPRQETTAVKKRVDALVESLPK